MFKVGQKVVLVDDKWPESVKQLYLQLPLLDNVYVVRAVRVGVRADELIMDMRRVLEQSILLTGLYNPTNKLGVEAGFAASRFRSLDELKNQATETVGQKDDALVCKVLPPAAKRHLEISRTQSVW